MLTWISISQQFFRHKCSFRKEFPLCRTVLFCITILSRRYFIQNNRSTSVLKALLDRTVQSFLGGTCLQFSNSHGHIGRKFILLVGRLCSTRCVLCVRVVFPQNFPKENARLERPTCLMLIYSLEIAGHLSVLDVGDGDCIGATLESYCRIARDQRELAEFNLKAKRYRDRERERES